jgi:hypothetical protein
MIVTTLTSIVWSFLDDPSAYHQQWWVRILPDHQSYGMAGYDVDLVTSFKQMTSSYHSCSVVPPLDLLLLKRTIFNCCNIARPCDRLDRYVSCDSSASRVTDDI